MKKLLFLALLLCSASLYAQTDTTYIYIDSMGMPAKGWEKASSFYKAYKQDSAKYILSHHGRSTQILSKETYLDADFTIMNGQYVDYRNGKPVLKGMYLNNEREGVFVRYDTSGRVIEMESYARDTLNGTYAQYWPNGVKKEAGNYKQGKKVGEWVAHYENDSLAIREIYNEDSKLVDSIYLDENGKATQKFSVMTPAIYPGGMDNFYKFFGDNLKYPSEVIDRQIGGTLFASFIINKEGSIEDIRIEKSPHYSFSKEVLRVLKKTAKWTPATFLGKKIEVKFTMPVRFGIMN